MRLHEILTGSPFAASEWASTAAELGVESWALSVERLLVALR
jgi:hypothetical protein